jgi:transcriptional regulator with XRE-family HTH domain
MRARLAASPDEVRERIREEIELRGVKQRRLAEHLGFSEKHMSQLLLGKVGMSLPILYRICAYLEMTLLIAPEDETLGQREAPVAVPYPRTAGVEGPEGLRNPLRGPQMDERQPPAAPPSAAEADGGMAGAR